MPFRPTPQTCFPPPLPPVDPGFVPCIGDTFCTFCSLTVETFLENDIDPLLPFHIGPSTNMATYQQEPGIKTWTSQITDANFNQFLIGIRCVALNYGMFKWQSRSAGRITPPSGTDITGSNPWRDAPSVIVSNDGYAYTIAFTVSNTPIWFGSRYHSGGVGGKLIERPDTSRSRPPNPPIPAIG